MTHVPKLPFQNIAFYLELIDRKPPKNSPEYLRPQLYLVKNPPDVRKAKKKIDASVAWQQVTFQSHWLTGKERN